MCAEQPHHTCSVYSNLFLFALHSAGPWQPAGSWDCAGFSCGYRSVCLCSSRRCLAALLKLEPEVPRRAWTDERTSRTNERPLQTQRIHIKHQAVMINDDDNDGGHIEMETKWGLPYLDLTALSVGLGTTEARRRTGCWVCSWGC